MVSIAEVERYKIEEKLAEVKFCTIMSDGSTDVSVSENEKKVYIILLTKVFHIAIFLD